MTAAVKGTGTRHHDIQTTPLLVSKLERHTVELPIKTRGRHCALMNTVKINHRYKQGQRHHSESVYSDQTLWTQPIVFVFKKRICTMVQIFLLAFEAKLNSSWGKGCFQCLSCLYGSKCICGINVRRCHGDVMLTAVLGSMRRYWSSLASSQRPETHSCARSHTC